jgi:NADPH:quinone reductase
MRAAVVRAIGPPESIAVEERPIPAPGSGEIVVQTLAAGVNFADLLMVAGQYQVKPPLPFVPGLELCGRITSVGAGVERWRPGDRIMGAPIRGGCFAEYVAVSAQHVFRAPESLSDELAAQFVVAYGTAAFALQRAGLGPGETLLVGGAGGGVGIAAVDIGARIGARVIAAASSPQKLRAARAHGAHEVVDYGSGELRPAIDKLTEGRGVDVTLDTAGGRFFDEALHCMARRGRILIVGFASGGIPRIPAERLLLKNVSVLGIGFGGILGAEPATVETVLEGLLALHAARPFNAEVAGRYGLEGVPQALRRVADRAVVGKQLIVPGLTAEA